MKSLRLILALSFASLLVLSVARAGDDKACGKMECCSKKGKDGKSSCATEGKSCCCDTGDQAKSGKQEEKK